MNFKSLQVIKGKINVSRSHDSNYFKNMCWGQKVINMRSCMGLTGKHTNLRFAEELLWRFEFEFLCYIDSLTDDRIME